MSRDFSIKGSAMFKLIGRVTILCSGVLLLFGCGSGSSVTLPQQKTATVVFSATNAPLTTSISGLEITAKMPAGANVRLKTGTANEIDLTSVTPKLSNSMIFAGSYSSATREITLIIAPQTVPSNWGLSGSIGPFVEIMVDCLPSLTKADFTSLNPTFPGFKASDGTVPGPTLLFTPSMDVLGL